MNMISQNLIGAMPRMMTNQNVSPPGLSVHSLTPHPPVDQVLRDLPSLKHAVFESHPKHSLFQKGVQVSAQARSVEMKKMLSKAAVIPLLVSSMTLMGCNPGEALVHSMNTPVEFIDFKIIPHL